MTSVPKQDIKKFFPIMLKNFTHIFLLYNFLKCFKWEKCVPAINPGQCITGVVWFICIPGSRWLKPYRSCCWRNRWRPLGSRGWPPSWTLGKTYHRCECTCGPRNVLDYIPHKTHFFPCFLFKSLQASPLRDTGQLRALFQQRFLILHQREKRKHMMLRLEV